MKRSQPFWLLFCVLLVGAVAGCGLRGLGWLQGAEWGAWDLLFNWRPAEPPSDRVSIVELTEADIQKFGQFPVSDEILAKVVETIAEEQPRAIGLNLVRDLPVPPGHNRLTQLFQETPNLIGVKAIDVEGEAIAPPPGLPPERVALSIFKVDRDGIMRKGPLFSGKSEENLPTMLAYLYLKPEGIEPQYSSRDRGWLQLGNVHFPPFEANDGGYIRGDSGDYQTLINFRRSQGLPFERITFSEILGGEYDPELIRDRVVIVGSGAISAKKQFFTPIGHRDASEIHAHLTSHILSAVLDGRPVIRIIPEAIECFYISTWMAIALAIIWRLRRHRWFVAWGVGLAIALCALEFAIAYALFAIGGWWVPWIPSIIATIAVAIAAMLAAHLTQLREAIDLQQKLMLGLAHDVRGPNGYVLNYAQFCFDEIGETAPNTELIREFLEYIVKSSEVVESICSSLLLPHKQLETVQISPNETFRLAGELNRYRYTEVAIEEDFDPELDRQLYLLEGIATILYNLIKNSFDELKNNPRRNPTIRLTSRDRGEWIELEVWDNGTGIQPDWLKGDRLFQAFEGSRSHSLGLGLFTSKLICDRAGGRIAVETQLGRYTKFTISLPKQPPPEGDRTLAE